MSKLRYSASISLDGFAAGPDHSREHPLGRGGRALHEWTRVAVERLVGPESAVSSAGVLGAAVRLLDDTTLDKVTLEQAFVVERPGVTHLKYRVLH